MNFKIKSHIFSNINVNFEIKNTAQCLNASFLKM